jgi:hypothetical protein
MHNISPLEFVWVPTWTTSLFIDATVAHLEQITEKKLP